jgi:replicative DNA helicase
MKQSCLVFSLEQPREQIGERLLSSMTGIGLQDIRSGSIKDGAWSALSLAGESLAKANLHIDDASGLSTHDVRSRARRVSRKSGLDLIIVDYIQLMRGEGQNRTQEVGQISTGLKALAKELKVPVIALSQLNRGLVQRPDKRPVMSDLRDSGQIEQDADLVLLIHRDEDRHGVAELNLAKHRNGPTGRVILTFLGEYCRFGNYAGLAIDMKPLAKKRSSGFDYSQTKDGE